MRAHPHPPTLSIFPRCPGPTPTEVRFLPASLSFFRIILALSVVQQQSYRACRRRRWDPRPPPVCLRPRARGDQAHGTEGATRARSSSVTASVRAEFPVKAQPWWSPPSVCSSGGIPLCGRPRSPLAPAASWLHCGAASATSEDGMASITVDFDNFADGPERFFILFSFLHCVLRGCSATEN